MQAHNWLQVRIQCRGPGPSGGKDAEGPPPPHPLRLKHTPFPHPDPWLLAVWRVRVAGSPDTGRLELLLRPCLGGTPQKAKRQGLQREACWEDWGLEMLPSLASLDPDDAGWSHSLGQENPDPASLEHLWQAHVTRVCFHYCLPADRQPLEGLPHLVPLALNTPPGGETALFLARHLRSPLLWGQSQGPSPHRLQDQPPALEN